MRLNYVRAFAAVGVITVAGARVSVAHAREGNSKTQNAIIHDGDDRTIAAHEIGDPDPRFRCIMSTNPADQDRCKGISKAKVFGATTDDAEKNARWLLGLTRPTDWRDQRKTKRRGRTAGRSPEVTIRAIGDAKGMPLKDLNLLGDYGLVVARMDVEQGSDVEEKYGLVYSVDYEPTFYVVLNGFKSTNPTIERGTEISKYSLYRIKKADGTTRARLELFRPPAAFRWCTMTHGRQQRFQGSRFSTCLSAEEAIGADSYSEVNRAVDLMYPGKSYAFVDILPKLIARKKWAASFTAQQKTESAIDDFIARSPKEVRSTLSNALKKPETISVLAKFADDESISTLWMTCGVGCCTAEF